MGKIQSVAPKILKKARKAYGYTQNDVAEWIGTSRGNYSRKEKLTNGVALTADEFLVILGEFQKRGPKEKNKKVIQNILDDLIYK